MFADIESLPTGVTQNGGILTIARLAAVGSAGDSIEITATYTVPEGAAGKTISNTAVAAAEDIEDEDEEHVEVKSYTVTITPADIVNYTGGSNYSGTVDSAGNVIGNTQYNGLPEPGYYLILSNAVNEWIAANDTDKTTPDDERLDDILTLTYQVGAVISVSILGSRMEQSASMFIRCLRSMTILSASGSSMTQTTAETMMRVIRPLRPMIL